jgi:uncharacterized protein (TIGR03118 family)
MRSLRCVIGLAGLLAVSAAMATGQPQQPRIYSVHNLVSDGAASADEMDQNLKNPWGIVFNPNGFVWVANNHSSTSTLYDGSGVKQSLIVSIPSGSRGDGSPTGIVYNGSNDFVVQEGAASGASRFIFAGENGTLSGWAPNVDVTHAVLVYDDITGGAIYKGLALAANGAANYLYATDFHNGKVDVFDKNFQKVTLTGKFSDPSIPAHYAPFGIQNLQGNIYVTYAKQDADAEDDTAGPGFGFVNVFDSNGQLIRRVASRGRLNAPWGMAVAPADFGRFSNRLLIGNFGDGTINAFDLATGLFLGKLRGAGERPVQLEGLWGLNFGNGLEGQNTSSLFFAAGPNDEEDGVYGRIDVTSGD